jgi:hypothetical protein
MSPASWGSDAFFTLILQASVELVRPLLQNTASRLMGQQSNKIIKRRRRAAYLKRKNELSKQGVSRKVSRPVKAASDADKKAAVKKPAVKKAAKAPAAKKAPEAAPAQDAPAAAEENS